MQDQLHSPEAVGWLAPWLASAAALLAKLLPTGVGAAIMIAVDPPATKLEMFLRAFVAFGFTYLFADTLFDFLRTTSPFAFFDPTKRHHHVAVDGFVGAVGWALTGAAAIYLKQLKKDPLKTIAATKEALK